MSLVTPSPTCRAPHVALRFSPDGSVHACCVNDRYPLGRVQERSLAEIWGGEEIGRLRQALDAGDYSLGCEDCATEHVAGARLQTHAEQYDRYPQPSTPLVWPKRVEFALSNTCNLQCLQCNGDLSSAIRAQRERRPPLRSSYDDAFFAQLPPLLEHLEVAVFIGGEPFLAREVRRVWDLMIELGVRPEVHVTTNGTVWDDRVERYVHELRMNVAVSIDGATAETNDRLRVGSRFDEVVANRDRFLAATRSYGAAFTINHCLLRANWHELSRVLREGDRLDVPVHVIPVTYPPSMSLFSLPEPELRSIVDTMARDRRARRLGRNRGAWDATLAHLRSQLAGRRTPRPLTDPVVGDAAPAPVERVVEVRPLTVTPPRPERLDAIRAELRAWSGQELLEIRTEDELVASVSSPPWADPLGLQDLVGCSLVAVDERTLDRLGPMSDERADTDPDGVAWTEHVRRPAGGEVRIRAAVISGWGVLAATPDRVDALV